MENAHIENDNIVFPARSSHQEKLVFPIELLEAISNLGEGSFKLEEALMFYKITKEAKEWRWTTPEALAGFDLTGWEFYYYMHDYDDSGWANIGLSREIKVIGEVGINNTYEMVDLDGETGSWVLEAGQDILLVKLSNEEFANRVAANEANQLMREAHAAQRAIRDAADAQYKIENADPLDAWELELRSVDEPK
jgi:hypothetical protein